MRPQFLEHFFDLAGQEAFQVMNLFADTVVGDTPLGKVVSADALRAVAGSDQLAPLLCLLALLFFLLRREQVPLDPVAQEPAGVAVGESA